MPSQDTSNLKDRIVMFLKIRGPSLPVHIAKEIGMSILFTSAFLSELIAERRIKISDMKVGSSSLHFVEGQEPRLEAFAQYLKSREKDAFELLKQKRFLKDIEQEPAIRVALRAIKDFAVPFQINNEIVWRYFTIPESEYEIKKVAAVEIKQEPKKEIEETQEVQEQEKEEKQEPKEKIVEIFDKEPKKETKHEKIKKLKKKPSVKKDDKFFDKVKEFLSQKNIEILGIEGFSKGDIELKVKENETEMLLVAFNKKRISETEIIKAGKKASEIGIPYIIVSFGEPMKKLTSLIDAVKGLKSIEKIE